jgi:hypothetical protein
MRILTTLAIALLTSVAPARATTIAFSDLLNAAAFTTYSESGFTVSAISGSWESNVDFGNPAPFIWFNREADDPATTAQIEITQGGLPFAFTSADLYSSLTTTRLCSADFSTSTRYSR